MAHNSLQFITTPRLYVSYPLWQYANGGLTHLLGYANGVYGGVSDEDLIRVLHLDPSDTIELEFGGSSSANFHYGIVADSDLGTGLEGFPQKLWNFNYAMVLNHNLASAHVRPYLRQQNTGPEYNDYTFGLASESIINHGNVPDYDGFSIFSLLDGPFNFTDPVLQFGFWNPNSAAPEVNPVELGTIMFGKYFDFPQNVQIEQSMHYKYDVKNRKTVGGKTIPVKRWLRPKTWANTTRGGGEPFGLRHPRSGDSGHYQEYINDPNIGANFTDMFIDDDAYNFRRRTGKRVWKFTFDSLSSEYVMNQNPMMNSSGFKTTTGTFPSITIDNYELDEDGKSKYTIDDGIDFYTDVVHKTNGGQIPMVLQVDKGIPSPEKFAIVKMSEYSITQTTPGMYSLTTTLIEQ